MRNDLLSILTRRRATVIEDTLGATVLVVLLIAGLHLPALL